MGEKETKVKDAHRRGSMTEAWREKIQVGNILTRMNKHAMKTDGDLMTPSQVRAAEILLKKMIPDLKSVAMTGDSGGPLMVEVVIAPHVEVNTVVASLGAAAEAAADDDDDDAEDPRED